MSAFAIPPSTLCQTLSAFWKPPTPLAADIICEQPLIVTEVIVTVVVVTIVVVTVVTVTVVKVTVVV